jgi:hypothetical protein
MLPDDNLQSLLVAIQATRAIIVRHPTVAET